MGVLPGVAVRGVVATQRRSSLLAGSQMDVAPVVTHSAHSLRCRGLTDVIASRCAQCPLDVIRSVLPHHAMDEPDAIERSPTAEATDLI